MMRAAFWLLLLAAVAVGVALLIRLDQGYAVLVYPPWRIEMSMALAVGVIVLLFVLVYVLLQLLRTTLRLPAEVRSWRARQRRDKAENELGRAMAALLSGQTAHARRLAQQAQERHPGPLATLVAARAALDEGDLETARRLLASVSMEEGELIAARQALERPLAQAQGASGPPAIGSSQVPWNSKESE